MVDDRVRFPFGESQEGGLDPLLDSQELSGSGLVTAPGGQAPPLPRSSGSDAAGPADLEPISAEGEVEEDRLVASDPAWRKLDQTDERELDIDDGLLRSQTLPPASPGVDRGAPTTEDKDGDLPVPDPGRREAPTDTGPVDPPAPTIPAWMRAEALAPATGPSRPSARLSPPQGPPPAKPPVYESDEGPAIGWAPDFSDPKAPPKGSPATGTVARPPAPPPKGPAPKGSPATGTVARPPAPPPKGPAPKGSPATGAVARPPAPPKGPAPKGSPATGAVARPPAPPKGPAPKGSPATGAVARPPAPPKGPAPKGSPATGAVARPPAPPKGPGPQPAPPPKREPTPVSGWAPAPGVPFERSKEGPPIAPSTPSGRHVGPPPGAAARAPLWSQAVPAAAAPATPSGRHVAPPAGTTPHEAAWSQALPAAGGRSPSGRVAAPPAPPAAPKGTPPGTPEAPLPGPAATTETIIVPLDDSGDGPTPPASPPAGASPTPASELPTSLDVEADPEKTQPESLDELGSLEHSGSGTGSATGEAPRGLTSGAGAGATDELRWPEGPSQRLAIPDAQTGGGSASRRAPGPASARAPAAGAGDVETVAPGYTADARTVAPGSAAGGPDAEAPQILDPGSGIGEVDGSSEIRGQLPFESSRLAKAAQDFDLDSELGRRTAELETPDVKALQGRRSALWEDSDLTPLPALEGSAEGPVEGLLDSQIGVVEPDDAPQPGGPAPSLRLVQASVERVVGLWEGEALWVGISLAGALVGPLFVLIGWEYYHLPKADRALHALHAALKPGGSLGLVFGISGAALFLLNLTYVLRRRFGLVKSLVTLRMWLNIHFICGITGGSLILVHSALLANNLVARFSSAAIGVAIASGIFGRYVLSRLPRRRDGENADLADRADVAARLTDLRRQLRTRLEGQEQLRDATLAALQDEAEPERPPAKGILFVVPLVLGDIASFVRWWKLSRKLKGMARGTKDPQVRKVVNEALALARVKRLEVRLAQYDAVRDLMDTWRGVHLVVALVVIATMALHVVLVLQYGVLRPFGR